MQTDAEVAARLTKARLRPKALAARQRKEDAAPAIAADLTSAERAYLKGRTEPSQLKTRTRLFKRGLVTSTVASKCAKTDLGFRVAQHLKQENSHG